MDNEKRSFESYFNEYYEQAKRYVHKRVDDKYEVEDIVMDSFMSIYRHFDEYDSNRASFSTWMYVILNNKLKNYYRDHKIFDELNEKQAVYSHLETDIVQAQYISMLRDDLATALLEIGPIQREIIRRKYFENQKSEEIGKALGMTAVNVRVQLKRTLGKLKKYFEEMGINWENYE